MCFCNSAFYTPASTKLKGGILVSRRPSVCPSVCLSVCGHNRVRSVTSTILAGCIPYLHIVSSNFRGCVACNAVCKIIKFYFWQIFQMCNFDFVLFWLGIWYVSITWVITGRQGYSKKAGVVVILAVLCSITDLMKNNDPRKIAWLNYSNLALKTDSIILN